MVITSPGVKPGQNGSVTLNLEGKIEGEFQASLSVQFIDQRLPNTPLAICGPFNIKAGLLGGKRSDMARDHLIVLLLGKLADLF